MAATNPVAAMLTSLLPLVLMFVIFYFFLIRPQRKKDKKVKEMLAALKPGDRITTIGGIYGTITGIKDDTITLAIGSQRTEMVVTRWAIRQVEEVTVENDGEILA
ncbi:MAG: preprotein translocase subunit YajC [Clostridia bacterium]|nr:preprotein translocase subunit YajC [Clostridia bacterium]